jgi:pyruvate,water dikinase
MSKKASNINELARHGVDVPNGFHLDESHYREAIWPVRNTLISTVGDGTAARRIFSDLELPARTIRALEEGLNRMPLSSNFAVRSSGSIVSQGRAIAEDGRDISLAGQFESFLNVPRGQLHDAVRQCWASLFNDRSIQLFQVDAGYVANSSMTVLVQEMAAATASAVVMTVDPLGDGKVGAIELTLGPCEAIVGGFVSPDEVTFHRAGGYIVEQRIGSKEFAIEYRPFSRGTENSTHKRLPQRYREQLSVSEGVLTKIIAVALRIENIFGVPQDVEIVVNDAGRIIVVQARSITRLPDQYIPFSLETINH